jgi:hypothetical protein
VLVKAAKKLYNESLVVSVAKFFVGSQWDPATHKSAQDFGISIAMENRRGRKRYLDYWTKDDYEVLLDVATAMPLGSYTSATYFGDLCAPLMEGKSLEQIVNLQSTRVVFSEEELNGGAQEVLHETSVRSVSIKDLEKDKRRLQYTDVWKDDPVRDHTKLLQILREGISACKNAEHVDLRSHLRSEHRDIDPGEYDVLRGVFMRYVVSPEDFYTRTSGFPTKMVTAKVLAAFKETWPAGYEDGKHFDSKVLEKKISNMVQAKRSTVEYGMWYGVGWFGKEVRDRMAKAYKKARDEGMVKTKAEGIEWLLELNLKKLYEEDQQEKAQQAAREKSRKGREEWESSPSIIAANYTKQTDLGAFFGTKRKPS